MQPSCLLPGYSEGSVARDWQLWGWAPPALAVWRPCRRCSQTLAWFWRWLPKSRRPTSLWTWAEPAELHPHCRGCSCDCGTPELWVRAKILQEMRKDFSFSGAFRLQCEENEGFANVSSAHHSWMLPLSELSLNPVWAGRRPGGAETTPPSPSPSSQTGRGWHLGWAEPSYGPELLLSLRPRASHPRPSTWSHLAWPVQCRWDTSCSTNASWQDPVALSEPVKDSEGRETGSNSVHVWSDTTHIEVWKLHSMVIATKIITVILKLINLWFMV